MESDKASAPATSVSALSAGAGVSFSIAKRAQSKFKDKAGGSSRARPSGGLNGAAGTTRDFVYSLEEGNIHRWIGMHSLVYIYIAL